MRWILHVRVEGLVLAVALRHRPDLAGLPVVVGGAGDPAQRAVVADASAEARDAGVKEAMPLRTAARRCPDAVFLPLDAAACTAESRRVMAMLRAFPGTWEVAGWTEAYADVETDDPESLAREIRAEIARWAGLRCLVGIGENKLQAKVASTLAGPDGVRRLTQASWPAEVSEEGPALLAGVGPARTRRLAALGITEIGELARADAGELAAVFGPATGPRLRQLARGEDAAPVTSARAPARSHGHAHTFARDVRNPALVRRAVERLAADVAGELAAAGREAAAVTVAVRTAPFTRRSRTVRLEAPSNDPLELERAAGEALRRLAPAGPVRTVGVRAALSPHAPRRRARAGERQLSLLDPP